MKLHHLACGCMCPLGGRLWNDRSRGLAAFLPCHCWLIEGRDGLILVDTGLGTRDVVRARERLSPFFRALDRPRFDEEDTAVRQVERLGFRSRDVRHVLLTHLDFDHAGGLADFPSARAHVAAIEYAAARRARGWRARGRYRSSQWGAHADWAFHDARVDSIGWFGLEARPISGLGANVVMIPLPGHSPGHVGWAVETAEGWHVHAGDAYFNHQEIEGARRRCAPAARVYQTLMETDREERRSSRRKLRRVLEQNVGIVRVNCAHDPAELDRAFTG